MSDNEKSPMLELAALWIKETKDGNKIMTGKLNNLNIMVVKNKYKKQDNHPDYKILMAKPAPKPEQGQGQGGF